MELREKERCALGERFVAAVAVAGAMGCRVVLGADADKKKDNPELDGRRRVTPHHTPPHHTKPGCPGAKTSRLRSRNHAIAVFAESLFYRADSSPSPLRPLISRKG